MWFIVALGASTLTRFGVSWAEYETCVKCCKIRPPLSNSYSTLRCNWPGWCDERMEAYWGTQDKRIVTTVKLEVNRAGQ